MAGSGRQGLVLLVLLVPLLRSAWVAPPAGMTPQPRTARQATGSAMMVAPLSSGEEPLSEPDLAKRPIRRAVSPHMPPAAEPEEAGFVFGHESVERVLSALRNGSVVLLTEDGSLGTSGSLLAAPSLVDAAQIEFLLEHAVRLQVALSPERYRSVYRSLRSITLDNSDLDHPAISVSAQGGSRSSRDAAHIASTVHALAADWWDVPKSKQPKPAEAADGAANKPKGVSDSLLCPGAVSLSCAREGGVLRRAGVTEAAVELSRLAYLPSVGMHASLHTETLEEAKLFADTWGIEISSTADLIAYVRRRTAIVERCSPPVGMPTKHGRFIAHTYRSSIDGTEHIALVKADERGDSLKPFAGLSRPALVRVHSECCTGDVFGSLRCDCGPQLDKALQDVNADGWGVVLYLRGQEGRGIGLGAKMHAYALQERGVDTLDANLELGLPVDSREYGTGAQILADLGITDMRLMSNNPKKFSGLTGYGLRIVDRVPSHTAPNPENIQYLRTKRARMGHLLTLGEEEMEGVADDMAAEGFDEQAS